MQLHSRADAPMTDQPLSDSRQALTLKALWRLTDSGFGDLGGCDDFYVEPRPETSDGVAILRSRKAA